MKIIELNEVVTNLRIRVDVIKGIKRGKIFVYPTDTVYGLGCNAEDSEAVWTVRGMKHSQKPFSVVAPSKEWINENLIVKYPEYIEKLPGNYTLILEKKRIMLKEANRPNTLGVRIPKHPFTKIIQEAGVPFITTSANTSGKEEIKEVAEIPEEMKPKIDFVIDGGIIDNPPSKVIDLTKEKPEILRG